MKSLFILGGVWAAVSVPVGLIIGRALRALDPDA